MSNRIEILHLDNSEFFRKIMKSFLLEKGFGVKSTDNGDEALNLIKTKQCNVIIMGMTFADMDGISFIKTVLSLHSNIPVIVVSSNDAEDEKEKLLALGIKAYVMKSEKWQEKLYPILQEL